MAARRPYANRSNKMTIHGTPRTEVQALPLDTSSDPSKNVPLQAGDVVTALFDPLSFTALGASARIRDQFRGARHRACAGPGTFGGGCGFAVRPKGVFIFRFESKDAAGVAP